VIERGDKVAKRIEREKKRDRRIKRKRENEKSLYVREREKEREGKVVRTALRTSNNCPEDEFG